MSGSSATVTINGSVLGTPLQEMLMADSVVPGYEPSYQLCKTIYLYHPLGAKMAEVPIQMAQSQKREVTVPDGPEERAVEAFEREWLRLGADRYIFNIGRLARVYGIASVVCGVEGEDPAEPLDLDSVADKPLYFNVYDPLNTAGSMVLNQEPNAPDFQKVRQLSVDGQNYHRSRAMVLLNEQPIYISYTGSAFGYVGRSVYQRALYPLKSFVQSMITDDMVTRKAGVLIAKMKAAGSIVNQMMVNLFALKREMLVQAKTDNVLGISIDESIESLNLQNIDGANGAARKNILENIATATPMPAKLLLQETFAEGFAEGAEDAKYIAQFIDRVRLDLAPVYAWFDRIVQHRAWNREFYKTIQRDYPEEYGDVTYEVAFYRWRNSFVAEWPSLLREPDSEKIKVDEIKLKSVISLIEVFLPNLPPEEKAKVLMWATDNFNDNKLLFSTPLVLDWDVVAEFAAEQQEKAEQSQSQADGAADQGAADASGQPPAQTGGAMPNAPEPEKLAA